MWHTVNVMTGTNQHAIKPVARQRPIVSRFSATCRTDDGDVDEVTAEEARSCTRGISESVIINWRYWRLPPPPFPPPTLTLTPKVALC
uniref:Uncharacterized protein n=1 Tax=Mesocestoides corti TaxID=53468 RepID=A0A5K3ERT7_MESCO